MYSIVLFPSTLLSYDFCIYLTYLYSQANEISKKFESSEDRDKIEALKTCIVLMLNGEDVSHLLMTVIRFCITSENHQLKKLLQVYMFMNLFCCINIYICIYLYTYKAVV